MQWVTGITEIREKSLLEAPVAGVVQHWILNLEFNSKLKQRSFLICRIMCWISGKGTNGKFNIDTTKCTKTFSLFTFVLDFLNY